jgi:3-keto-disaccharide hydrolase
MPAKKRIEHAPKDAKANSGVFGRIDDGILRRLDEKHPPASRDTGGKLSKESLAAFMEASEQARRAWYAVHHGYEVQVCDDADPYHRTGAVYSLARAEAAPKKKPSEWRTMVITLDGDPGAG